MNLTLVGGEGGTRLKASPWGGDSGSEGAMAARDVHAALFQDAPAHSPKPPSQPMPDLIPAPGAGTEQNLGSLPARREGS